MLNIITQDSLLTISGIGKFSRLLRPVGPAFMSQKASRGSHSHDPYPLQVCEYFTLTTAMIGRSPILKRRSFNCQSIPALDSYRVLASLSQDYPQLEGMLTTCY